MHCSGASAPRLKTLKAVEGHFFVTFIHSVARSSLKRAHAPTIRASKDVTCQVTITREQFPFHGDCCRHGRL